MTEIDGAQGGDYYSQRLSARRLKRVYDIAPLRVQQYLEAEIGHVLKHVRVPSVDGRPRR